MLSRWLHIVKKIIMLTWKTFKDHMHLIKNSINAFQEQETRCLFKNFWSFEYSYENVSMTTVWINTFEHESVLILVFKSLICNWIKEWRMCINVNHKKMILRYHLMHDDDKVNNKMTLTELTLLLFDHKHHDLFEQECFIVIMMSESYSTWMMKIIHKNEFNWTFNQKTRIIINVKIESTLYNFKYEISFIVWSFFYQNEFDRDHKIMIESLRIMLKLLRNKRSNTWFFSETLMSWGLNDLMKLIICLETLMWLKDSKLNLYTVNVLITLDFKYKKLKKKNEQIAEMKFCVQALIAIMITFMI